MITFYRTLFFLFCRTCFFGGGGAFLFLGRFLDVVVLIRCGGKSKIDGIASSFKYFLVWPSIACFLLQI